MKKIRSTEVEPQLEEEKTNMLMTSPSLLCLPHELVVMVASYLEVSSYLALASSSNALLDILLSQNQWKTLLKKTRWGTGQGRMNNEFISTTRCSRRSNGLRYIRPSVQHIALSVLNCSM